MKRLALFIFMLLLSTSCANPSWSELLSLDEERLLQRADAYLAKAPKTVTAFPAARSVGGRHDYYSEGSYWWPDPDNPDGPYIRKDGFRNPDNFMDHHQALGRLRKYTTTLVAAYKVTGDEKYAAHATAHLQAWFVEEATRMNPNLQYAQAIKGRNTGRYIGIIDTQRLVGVAVAAQALRKMGYLKGAALEGVQLWFTAYGTWLTTSEFGQNERDHGNNHSTWWGAQVAAFAKLTDRNGWLPTCQQLFKKLLDTQMAADGSFPKELARTRPFGYSGYNLNGLTTLAWLASTPSENLWTYESPNGTLKKAVDFMFPYTKDKSKWPYEKDVAKWSDEVSISEYLILAADAYDEPKYRQRCQELTAGRELDEEYFKYWYWEEISTAE
ncbi:MAG: alginate lyase family protein [Bacteroidota bacterium]